MPRRMQIDEQRREARLHDVAAEHEHDAALARRAAVAIASTTARKSRATSTSGSAAMNAANERSSPGGCANSAALTLFGRRATGMVRIGGEIRLARRRCVLASAPDSAGALVVGDGGTI